VDIVQLLQEEFKLDRWQVENTIRLIDDGNTIPFIARYRKEMTGELNDQVLREFYDRLVYIKNLQNRKEEVKRLIEEQGQLTDEIIDNIDKANTLQEVEDIYRPYRPKKRTRASIAKEKGLEPLAEILWTQDVDDIDSVAMSYINPEKEIYGAEDAINGAMDIIAEKISDNAEYRKVIRQITFRKGVLLSKAAKQEDSVYSMYYDFK